MRIFFGINTHKQICIYDSALISNENVTHTFIKLRIQIIIQAINIYYSTYQVKPRQLKIWAKLWQNMWLSSIVQIKWTTGNCNECLLQ